MTILLLTFLAQTPVRTSGLSGIVVVSGKGTPLSKAVVVLQPDSEGLRPYTAAATSTDGRFSFEDVAPGRYRLSATRVGYFPAESAATNPTQCGTVVTVEANRQLADLSVAMMPGGVIAGRVQERDGEPASNVTVQAIKYTYQNGNRVLTSVESTKTNDLGEYRLFYLPPGRYLVAAALDSFAPRVLRESFDDLFQPLLRDKGAGASPDPAAPTTSAPFVMPPVITYLDSAARPRPSSQPGPRISPLYYPSSPDPKTASPIEVRAGETFHGADLLVSRVEPRTIRGAVRNSASSDPFKGMSVSLVSRVAQPNAVGVQSARVGPDGGFEITNVLPGTYTLMAEGGDNSGRLIGRLPVDVVASDIQNVELVVSRGLSISGRVSTDNSQDMARITGVSLASISEDRMASSSSLSAKVTDGAFTIDGIPPGKYLAYVSFTAPANIYMKSMRLGSADVRNGFSLDAAPGVPLDIVVGLNGAAVQGTIVGDNGQPLRNATVVLVPDTFLRQRSSLYKFATSDVSGAFAMASIAPGDYKIFAWESVEQGAWEDPDFLRNYEARGQSLTLREASRQAVQITALPSTGTVYNACEVFLGPR